MYKDGQRYKFSIIAKKAPFFVGKVSLYYKNNSPCDDVAYVWVTRGRKCIFMFNKIQYFAIYTNILFKNKI